MSGDSAVRARVDGRAAVATRTVWSLTVRAQPLRCVRVTEEPRYRVEARTDGRWSVLSSDTFSCSYEALRRVVGSGAIRRVLQSCETRLNEEGGPA